MKKFLIIIVMLTAIGPYPVSAGTSVFGFGPNLVGTYRYSYSISALGRGGYEMGFIDSLNINQLNYALWTKLERTSISINFEYSGIRIGSNNSHLNSSDANFMGGFIAWPLKKKKLILGAGLFPRYTNNFGIQIQNVGPDNSATQEIESSGNVSEALVIGCYSISPKLSLAVEVGYNFGMMRDKNSLLYKNPAYWDVTIYDEYQMQGTNFGLSGFYEFNEKVHLGIKYKSFTDLTVHQERISGNLPEVIKQTRSIMLPSLLALGLNYRMSERWQAGLDCIYQNYQESYTVDDQQVSNVRDSYRLGLGFEKSPLAKRFVSYLQDISWRGGLFLNRMNVNINEKPVYEYGIAAGISLPIRKNRNRIDISVQYGQRGNKKSNILNENFFGINVAVLSSELWFVREKR